MSNQSENQKLLAMTEGLILKEKCRRDPLFWIQNYVKTLKVGKNRKQDEAALQPFPRRPYVAPLVHEWLNERIIHLAKSRQMSMTWFCAAMLLWEAQFHEYNLCLIINKREEDSVKEGVARAKIIYEAQPEWLKNLCPLDRKMRDMPMDILAFANGSAIEALPQGAEKVRGKVPATVLLDEARYQEALYETYSACVPCSSRIVTVSSAGPGFFKSLCCD